MARASTVATTIFLLVATGRAFAEEGASKKALEFVASKPFAVPDVQFDRGFTGSQVGDRLEPSREDRSPVYLESTAFAAVRHGELQDDRVGPGGPLHPGFGNFHRVLAYNFTRGLFSRDNLMPAIIGTAGALIAVPFDDEVSDALRGSAPGWGDTGHIAGGPVVVGASTAAILVATPFVKNERFRALSFTLAQSIILNNALAFSLKLAVSRTRPNEEDQNSFPSAHASNAFAWSTVVAHYYGKKIGIPAWIAAGAIALSRVEKGKHWLSDVIAGSTIGFISGITAARGSDHYASKRNWTVVPHFGTEHVALTFYYVF